jgi:hypothetical protein
MKQFMRAIGLSSMMLVGALAVAAPPASQSAVTKRQLNDCMSRRMAANRTLSYNDALRSCKERIQSQKEALASNSPSESGTKAH